MKLIEIRTETLYSGTEARVEDIVFTIEYEGKKTKVTLDDLDIHELLELEEKYDIKEMVKLGQYKLFGSGAKEYRTTNDLPLFYMMDGDYVIITSSGEHQRGGYKIVLESIWKIK